VFSSGWWFLAAMIAAYGIANLLQSIAAVKTKTTETLDPGLLLRLFGHRTYLLGLLCQIFGFFFALAARRDLPLFLVQSAVTAGLCVTALLGVMLLKWRLPLAEVGLLILVVLGIGALAASAEPSKGEPLGFWGIIALVVALLVIAGSSVFAGRLKGTLASVVLGSIAGLCFSSAAIAARPLAGAHTIMEFLLNPLLYLVIAHSLTGQLLLGLAMQRGSTNAAVAGMDAAGAVPAAIIGLLLLGDQMRPGLEWLAVLGFIVTLGAVIALTRYAEPQHELVAEPAPLPFRLRSASVPGLPEHPARGVVEVLDETIGCTTAKKQVTVALQRPIRRPGTPPITRQRPAGAPSPASGTNPTGVPNGPTPHSPSAHTLGALGHAAKGHDPAQTSGGHPTNGQATPAHGTNGHTNGSTNGGTNGHTNGGLNGQGGHDGQRRPLPVIID
jgi:drug/metabolite transporter (DMT)-like permease